MDNGNGRSLACNRHPHPRLHTGTQLCLDSSHPGLFHLHLCQLPWETTRSLRCYLQRNASQMSHSLIALHHALTRSPQGFHRNPHRQLFLTKSWTTSQTNDNATWNRRASPSSHPLTWRTEHLYEPSFSRLTFDTASWSWQLPTPGVTWRRVGFFAGH